MASLLDWFKKEAHDILGGAGHVAQGVERQINPFDHGATYANPNPRPAPRPQYNPGQPPPSLNFNTTRFAQPNIAQIPQLAKTVHPVAVQPPKFNLPVLGAAYTLQGINNDAKNMAISAARAIPQALESTGLSLTHQQQSNPASYNPIEKALLGNEPVKNLGQTYRDTANILPGNLGTKTPKPLAAALGVGLAATNFMGLDSLGKNVVEDFAKAGTREAVDAIAKNQGIKLTEAIANKLVTAKNATAVKDLLASKGANKAALDSHIAANGVKVPNVPVKLPTEVKHPVSQLKTLEAQGYSGSKLAQKTIDVQTTNDRLGASSVAQIPTVLKVTSDKESHNFQRVLQGLEQPINSKVDQAVKEWKAFHPGFRETGVKAGVKIGDRGPNYFPQNSAGVFKNNDSYTRAVDHLIQSGQAKDAGEATSMLESMRNNPSVRKSGYFKSRTLDTGALHDNVSKVAQDYIAKGAKTIAETAHYGKNLGKVEHLLGQVHLEGGNAQKARQIMNNLVAPEFSQSIGAKGLRAGRKLEAASKLGTAVISHAFQPLVNDSTRVGIPSTLKAYAARYSKANRQLVKDTGINYGIEHQRQLEQGVGGKLSKLTAPGLTAMQKFNRGVAAAAGKYKAQSLVKKAATGDAKAVEFLRNKLGVSGTIGKDLTPEQIIQAGRNEAIATHFSNNPAELPFFHRSELGKTVMQFRAAYGVKESGFIVNEVLKEAKAGNFGPLTRFAILAPIAGTGIYAGKAAVKNVMDDIFGGQNQVSLLPGNVLEAANRGGAFGVPGEIASGFKYTTNSAGKLDATKVLEALAGGVAPLAGEGAKTAVNAVKAINGTAQPLIHQELSNIPIVGGAVANAVSPYTGPGTSSNKDLDQAIADLKNAKDQPGGKWEDSLSKQDAAIAGLSKADRQALVDQGKISEADATRAEKLASTAKQLLNPPKKIDSNGINDSEVKFLQRYDRLTTDGKDKFKAEASNEYQMGQIKYKQDKANGKLTQAQDINRTEALAKLKVNAMKDGNNYRFNKETITGYGLSKGEIEDILAAPGGQAFADKIVAYGDELVKAGAIAKNKWRDSKGNISLLSKGSGGGGRKKGAPALASFKTASQHKAPTISGVKVRKLAGFKAPSVRKLSVSKIPSSYVNRKLA